MKQFNLDLRNFKKISEDDNSATLRHENGHEIKVAKNALSEGLKKQLASLKAEGQQQQPTVQHLADGGMVLGDFLRQQQMQGTAPMQIDLGMPQAAPAAPIAGSPEAQMAQNQDALQALNNPLKALFTPAGQPIVNPSSGANEPAAGPSNVSLAPAQAQPDISQIMGQGMGGAPGLGQAKAGIQAEAKAMGELGQQEAAIAREQQTEAMTLQMGFEAEAAQLQSERDALIADIKAGHINPDQFIESRSGGQKISMAIGLLLGGLGEGMTGRPNAALQFLNKRIEQDIDAQKANIGKQQSLLAANLQQYGNMRDAVTMTRAMQADIYKAKLEEAASRSKDPMAKARAMQAIGALDAQYGAATQQVAQRRALGALVSSGQLKPAQAVAYLPKEHQGKAIEEIKKYEDTQAVMANLKRAMNDMAAEQATGNRVMNPIQSNKKIGALKTSITAALKPVFGNLSESDKQEVADNEIGFLDSPQTVQTKIQNLTKIVEANSGSLSTPTLEMHGIQLPKSQSGFTPMQGLPNRK